MSAGTHHKVAQGESIESIAAETGHYWPSLWDHPDNDALRYKRQSPHILLPGDELVIPSPRPKHIAVSSGARYAFLRRGIPSRLRIQIMMNWRPRAHEKYTLRIDNSVCVEGATDAEGYVDCPISPTAKEGVLFIGDDGERQQLKLRFRHLDPISTDPGIEQRMENLGCLLKSPSDKENINTALDYLRGASDSSDNEKQNRNNLMLLLLKKHRS